jgi:hypothetical protein
MSVEQENQSLPRSHGDTEPHAATVQTSERWKESWFVVESSGDGAKSMLVHGLIAAQVELLRQMWCGGPGDDIPEDITETINDLACRDSWTSYYPTDEPMVWERDFEVGGVRVLRLSIPPHLHNLRDDGEAPPPKHPFELRIHIGGDDWEYVTRTMRALLDGITARGPEFWLISGGAGGCHSIDIQKRAISIADYHKELQAWHIGIKPAASTQTLSSAAADYIASTPGGKASFNQKDEQSDSPQGER